MYQETRIRAAAPEDSRFISEMIDIASDGVALIEWTEEAQRTPGRIPIEVGADLYASDQGDYSYRNCWVAVNDEQRVGMLLTFPMPSRAGVDKPAPPPFDGSDVFAPYKYLEAPDTWYICGIALLPEYRGRGIGTRLMEFARQQAYDQGYHRLSLVAFEENAGAVRLYQSLGYKILDRAPIVPHPLIRCRGDALLMVARVDRPDK